MSERNSVGDVLLAFVLGGVVGAAVGILFAPASGKETRKKIKEMSADLEEKAGEIAGEVKEKATVFAHDAKAKAEHFMHDAKEKFVDQKERLEAAFDAGKKVYEKQR